MKPPLHFSLAALALTAISLIPQHVHAQACEPGPAPWQWLWVGGPGTTWSQVYQNGSSNWVVFPGTQACAVFPNGTINDVYINDQQSNGTVQGTPICILESGVERTVGRLSIGSTSALQIQNSGALRFASETGTANQWYESLAQTLVNNGEITLGGTNATTAIVVGPGPRGGLLIQGSNPATSRITLGHGMIGAQFGHFGLNLRNLNNTIRGWGELGGGFNTQFSLNRLNIDNDGGIIDANTSGKALVVHLAGEQYGAQNSTHLVNRNGGILRASNGGTLEMIIDGSSGFNTTVNTGGTVSAIDGGTVRLSRPAIIEGGTVTTSNGGAIRGWYPGGDGGTLKDLTNNGLVAVAGGEVMRLAGTIMNNGSVVVQKDGVLYLRAGANITGPGSIWLPDGYPSFVVPEGFPASVAISNGQVLRGAGQINEIDFQINGGTIDADNESGRELNVILRYDGGTVIRNNANGTFRASKKGQLWFSTAGGGAGPSIVANDAANGAVIRADDDGIVRVRDGKTVVDGARFITTGNGRISGAEPGGGSGIYTNFINDGLVAAGANEGCVIGGTITNNGTIAAIGSMFLRSDTVINGPGTISVEGALHTPANGLDLNSGRMIGNGTVHGTVRNNSGVIAPGQSPGKLTINGNYSQGANGALTIELGGTTAGTQYDQLIVNGAATLGGALNLIATNGYKPAIGDKFTLITAHNFSGAFTAINTVGFSATTQYEANGVTITVTNVAPEITSSTSASGTQGEAFFYEITATNNPTSYGASGLPAGLSINASNGLISGTPDVSGVFNVTISASNSGGTGTAQLTLTIAGGATPTPSATPSATASPSPSATASPSPSPSPSPLPSQRQLVNIATRLRVQGGENVLIGGVIVTGNEPKKVIIRAIGPSLSEVFSGALADPVLELYEGETLLANNDNWKDTQQSEIEATTIPPNDERESAIVRTLPPGFYTAVMNGKDATAGIGVIEVYDLDQAVSSKLANIATRGLVESGDNVMIGGLIVGGNGSENARVLLRAIGPSLANAGVAGALHDPTLELRDNNGELVRENDNWQESQQPEIEATAIPPSDPAESAIVATLPSGNYTAVVRGKNDSRGVGLVEVYSVP